MGRLLNFSDVGALSSLLLVLLLCLAPPSQADQQDAAVPDEMHDAALLEDRGATPATEGATPATEGATPATEGATPATEGATPATEGATPATEGATPATGGATPATGGATPATGGATPATGGATPATGGATPATGGATPATGGATPATGEVSTTLPLMESLDDGPAGVPASERVNVSVYFEALCPDSFRFIRSQVHPVMEDLADIITLELHPYGKVRMLQDGQMICQHGPLECAANMLLSCAKRLSEEDAIFLNFTRCVMEQRAAPGAGETCANQTGVVYEDVDRCVTSLEGARLQQQEGEMQACLDPPLTYVPWITINGRFTWAQQVAAERHLRRVVCTTYQGPSPAGCAMAG
ncbi:gamma-interferon-inducible lysosomal thiol reductase-like [Eriocheir sinensis]|uniref:gamma-interferon-inducible lysosomal thiol reductase-like n=1 Tax=Eriocheir sinensis TaxID=95602 RepID=UPI0021C9CDAF|nr:gamma-interferon-inducible lysosomal thiol reductase-like [Eriocheir sinensis]